MPLSLPRRRFLAASASAWSAAALAGARMPAVARAISMPRPAVSGIAEILSVDKIHALDIKFSPSDAHWLDEDRNHHVACDVTIDGQTYKGANFSEKGDIGSSAPLAEKSGFNVRFGKDSPTGMKKLVLNNAKQDVSFTHEHIAYEIYRRAGLPATMTAHGAVTLNGQPYGVFVFEEAKDSIYLEKWFGKGNGKGNTYKAAGPVEFANDYLNPLLKDEDDNEDDTDAVSPAKRADLAALADAVNAPDDDTFLGTIRERMDLDAFITHYALDALVGSIDGPMYNDNNYVLYHNPADDRMVMLAHGLDQVLDPSFDPLQPPKLTLAQRVRAIADLEAQWRSEMNRVMDQVWNEDVLFDRIDHLVAIVQDYSGPTGDAIQRDLDYIKNFAPGVQNLIDARRAQWLAQPF